MDLITQLQARILCFFIMITCIHIGCRSSNSNEGDLWKNTQKITLQQETTSLRIPKSFKRSSKYRIKEDIPILQLDTVLLRSIENAVTKYEFMDKDVDIFVDTTQVFRYFIIVDTWLVDFDKFTGKVVNKFMSDTCKELENQLSGTKVEKIESKMKQNAQLKVLKYKLEIEEQLSGGKSYQTYFFTTNDYRNLLILEYSFELNDIENYLWTIKK